MWLPIEATRQGQTRGEDEHVSAAGRTRVGLVVVEAAETADERGFAWSWCSGEGSERVGR